jgi:hypothetical protein
MAICALLIGAVATTTARPDSYETVRKTINSVENGLVTVRLVWKMSMSYEGDSSNQEMKREVLGTVIDSSGLTIVSLSDADPTAMYSMIYGSDGPDIQASATDVKLLTSDGTQIASKVVLRDRDLNFMFIRPVTKLNKAMPWVNLASNPSVRVLDSVFVAGRLGKALNRAVGIQEVQIMSVLEKPRKRYVLDRAIVCGVGSPVFSLDGKAIGITTYKLTTVSAESRGESDSSAMSQRSLIIVPCSDVLKVARQAPQDEQRVSTPVKKSSQPGKTQKKPTRAK